MSTLTEAHVKRVNTAAGDVLAALETLAAELREARQHQAASQVTGYYRSILDLAERIERQYMRQAEEG